MLANADITVFESGKYIPHIIEDVYWFDSRGKTVSKGGIQISILFFVIYILISMFQKREI